MSRKDYERIAALIAVAGPEFKSPASHAVFAASMARTLRADNPRFDGARFMRAAMPSWVVGSTKEVYWDRAIARLTEEDAR